MASGSAVVYLCEYQQRRRRTMSCSAPDRLPTGCCDGEGSLGIRFPTLATLPFWLSVLWLLERVMWGGGADKADGDGISGDGYNY